jgi:hypothetical protein
VPKLPDKFEDWTWPWTKGEVDEERLAKLLYSTRKDLEAAKDRSTTLSSENETLKTELEKAHDDLEDAREGGAGQADSQLTEENKSLKRQVRELERDRGKRSPEDQKEVDRLTVALKLGLSLADSKRLVGSTLDEIEADARQFAEDHGIDIGDGDGGESNGNAEKGNDGPPRKGVVRPSDLTTGSGHDGGPIRSDTRKVLAELPPL